LLAILVLLWVVLQRFYCVLMSKLKPKVKPELAMTVGFYSHFSHGKSQKSCKIKNSIGLREIKPVIISK
jgi:hypothetical protein